MRSPTRRTFGEYKILIVKISMDMILAPHKKDKCVEATSDNFVDIELFLSIACFQPLLTIVHCLFKFA